MSLRRFRNTTLAFVLLVTLLPAAPAAAFSTGSISGTVLGEVIGDDAVPLEDVGVILWYPWGGWVTNTFTDENGEFVFSAVWPDSYVIEFVPASGSEHQTAFWEGDPVTLSSGQDLVLPAMTLPLGGSIGGVVLGEVEGDDPQPIVNLLVNVFQADTVTHDLAGFAYTDESGEYRVRGLPAGDYVVRFDPPGNHVMEWFNGKTSIETADWVTVGDKQHVNDKGAVLARGATISGVVQGAVLGGDPIPLEGLSVRLHRLDSNEFMALTNSSGEFTLLGIPPGTYKIRYEAAWGGPHASRWWENKSTFEAADEIEVAAQATLTGYDIVLPLRMSISGTVFGEVKGDSPESLSSVAVSLYDPDELLIGSTWTGWDGTFTLEVPQPGDYRMEFMPPVWGDHVTAWWEDRDTFATADVIPVAEGQNLTGFDPVLPLAPAGTISGVVTDEDESPVVGATVTAWADPGGGVLSHAGQTSTLSGGLYELTVPPGVYKVAFEATTANLIPEWYQGASTSSEATPVIVSQDEEKQDISAALRFGGTISGTIFDAVTLDGLMNVTVNAYSAANQQVGYTDLSPSGEYTIYGLDTGNYRVQAFSFGEHLQRWYVNALDFASAQDVPVVAGEDAVGFDIGLPVAGSFSGTITDALTEQPLISVQVTAYSMATGLVVGGTTTNSEGEFKMGFLEGGLYRAEFSDWAGSYVTQSYSHITVIPGQDTAGIDAALYPGGSISGTILGDPDAYYLVRLYDAAGEIVKSTSAASWNDHAYWFGGLAAGSYRIEVEGGVLSLDKWYSAGTDFDSATPIVVSAAADITDIDIHLDDAARISGTITDAFTGGHLTISATGLSLVVSIYDLSENLVAEADLFSGTDPNVDYDHYAQAIGDDMWVASYVFGGLAAGTYRVHFDGSGLGYSSEWYEDAASFESATNVVATLGEVTEDVDATLFEDITKPVIHVADRYVETTNAGGRTVTYTVSATDDVGVTVQPTCDPVSGSLFVVGETVVECSGAEDAAGNVAEPVQFTVEVVLVDGSSTVLTTVSSPVAGEVTVVSEPAGSDPVGFVLLGTKVVITAPTAESVDDPLVLEFVIAAAAIPVGVGVGDVVVFRNGASVGACTGAPSAVPDPCVSSRVVVDGDFVITVLTTQASDWEFGVAVDEDPEPDPGPALLLPDDITAEATGPGGAVVEFSPPAAIASEPIWEHLVFSYSAASLTRNPNSYNHHLEFRRAVAHAIDFERIIAEIPGAAVRLNSHFDAFVPGLSVGGWSQYEYHTTTAETLIGVLCAKTGVDCDANPPTVVFTTTSGRPDRELFAELLEEMLENVGITVIQEHEPVETFFTTTLDSGYFDIGSWAYISFDGLAGLAEIHDIVDPAGPWPDGGQNAAQYGSTGSRLIDSHSVRVGELIGLMAAAGSDAELEGYLAEMEGILVDQVVFIPLWLRADGTAECSYESGDTFPIGDTLVECSASRGEGTTVTYGSFTVTVEDTTAPVVTAPNRYVETTNPLGRAVSYPHVSAFDAVGVTVGPVCSPVSGSNFTPGTHTVNCSAEDAAGNTGEKSFTVTVNLIEGDDPPVVTSSVSSPVAGAVTVVTEPAGSDPVGFVLLGTKVVITAPTAESVDAPLVLEFVIAAEAIPVGVGVGDVVVFRNGVTVGACTGAPSAVPDPCVSSRVVVGGDFVITVLTTQASDWEFGVALDDPDPDPDPGPASVVRYAGSNRFATAVEISKNDFPDPSAVSLVFVAVGSNFPDALAGSAAAAALSAPLLLVNTTSIPDVTATELTRLNPAVVVVLGGEAVISPAVATALSGWGAVTRLAGSNRYATAAAISAFAFDDPSAVDEVIIATGANFPDALGGGPVATAVGGPVLLVPPTGVLPAAIVAELTRLAPLRITVLGGESAVSSGVFTQLEAFAGSVVRKAGSNRYVTAIEASKHGFASAERVYVAVGTNFPDALAGAAAAGFYDAPVLLVPSGSLPPEVAAEITRLGATKVIILGGTGVVSVAVENALKTLLGL